MFIDREVPHGTYNYRLKQIDFDGSYEYSDVVEVDIGLQLKYALAQNYPNPFNPITKIGFRIANFPANSGTGGFVTLKVYNVLGREIATLVNEEKEPGIYEVEFDGNSVSGGLNSGIYFYKLEDGDFSVVRKMTLIK